MAEKTEFVLGANFGTPYGSGSQLIFFAACVKCVIFLEHFFKVTQPFKAAVQSIFSQNAVTTNNILL
jgi:hypothetical protein